MSGPMEIEVLPYFSVRKFEILYSDVVAPLLRRARLQRSRHAASAGDSTGPPVYLSPESHPTGNSELATSPLRERTTLVNARRDSQPPEGSPGDRTPSQASEEQVFASEDDLQVQRLWNLLISHKKYFIKPLAQASTRAGWSDDVTALAGKQDPDFDKAQLAAAVQKIAPELMKVNIGEDGGKTIGRLGGPTGNAELDGPGHIGRREAAIQILVDHLASRLNLHQVECLRLVTVHLQLSQPDVPPAIVLESCIEPSADGRGDAAISHVGYAVIERCVHALRREQLFHLWCLNGLAAEMYPLEEPGVGLSSSVNVVCMAFYHELIKCGFIDNLIAALQFLIFESTRQRLQMHVLTSVGNGLQGFGGNTDREDRYWTGRMAQVAARILFMLAARFHLAADSLYAVAQLLAGSVFEEAALNRLRDESQVGSGDEFMRPGNHVMTTHDFDNSFHQESLKFGAGDRQLVVRAGLDDPFMRLAMSTDYALDMTTVLTLLFINAVDPTLVKWAVEVTADTGTIKGTPPLESVELPTARLSDHLDPDVTKHGLAGGGLRRDWLLRGSANHDIEPFWIESTFHGRFASFSVTVAFLRPSNTKRLQFALSSSWNLFHSMKEDLLDRLGGVTAASRLTAHTVASLLGQTFLPINPQWSQIVRADRLSRQARKKVEKGRSEESLKVFASLRAPIAFSILDPIIDLLNRLCALHPLAADQFSPILFSVIDAFPWHEMTSRASPPASPAGRSSDWTSGALAFSEESEGLAPSRQLLETGSAAWRGFAGSEIRRDASFEVLAGTTGEDAVPAISGLGIPSTTVRQGPVDGGVTFGFRSRSQRMSGLGPATGAGTAGDSGPVAVLGQPLPSDLGSLGYIQLFFPLSFRVLRFAATVTAVGPRAVALQLASKFTTQPSLLGFFLPHSLEILGPLFESVVSGRLQLELLSAFNEEKRARALRIRRGAFGPDFVEGGGSQFLDEDDEQEDIRYYQLVDAKVADIISGVGALYRYFTAAFSPRLWLTAVLPPHLIPQGPNLPLQLAEIVDHSYIILRPSVDGGTFGVAERGSFSNALSLVSVKCVVLEGLASGLETGAIGALQVFRVFVEEILPVLSSDLKFLKNVLSENPSALKFNRPSEPKSQQESTRHMVNETAPKGCSMEDYPRIRALIGRLAISTVAYLLSVMVRIGYRYRYSSFSSELFGGVDPSQFLTAETADRPSSLFLATRFVLSEILPLLRLKALNQSLPSWHFWKLSALAFKFLRSVARGPLPRLGHEFVDSASYEAFLPKVGSLDPRSQMPMLSEREAEASVRDKTKLAIVPHEAPGPRLLDSSATEWLMRCFLAIDSLATSLLIELVKSSWEDLLIPWNSAENSAGIFQLQMVEAGLDILRILFQRDSLFLSWWSVQRAKSVKEGRSATESAASWGFLSGLVPINVHLLKQPSRARAEPFSERFNGLTVGTGRNESHAAVLLGLALSEEHPTIRKKTFYVLMQLTARDPSSMRSLFKEIPQRLSEIQDVIASVLRDLELEEIERSNFFDALGVLEDPGPRKEPLPDQLLFPFWSDVALPWQDAEEGYGGRVSAGSVATAADKAAGAWGLSDSWEMRCLRSEIVSVDFNVAAFASTSTSESQKPVLDLDELASSLVTSKSTALPISNCLERKLNLAEDIAYHASDSAAWLRFVSCFKPPQQMEHFMRMASLQEKVIFDLPFLAPILAAKATAGISDGIAEVAYALMTTPREGSLSLLSYSYGIDGMTSRSLCFTFLYKCLSAELETSFTACPTSLLILGYSTESTVSPTPLAGPHLPLPYVSSPFTAAGDPDMPNPSGSWFQNPMAVLDALFLIIDEGFPPIDDIASDRPGGTFEPTTPDADHVERTLHDPTTYSPLVQRDYSEGCAAVLCLEILTILLTHPQTADATLHLLFVRLPHRHAVFTKLWEMNWEIPPPLSAHVGKMMLASWAQVLSSECHLCTMFLKTVGDGKHIPQWIRKYSGLPQLDKSRMRALQNQCNQVLEFAVAIQQSPAGKTGGIHGLDMGITSPDRLPTLLACLLVHMQTADAVALPPTRLREGVEDPLFSGLYSASRYRAFQFHRRSRLGIEWMSTPILDVHHSLLLDGCASTASDAWRGSQRRELQTEAGTTGVVSSDQRDIPFSLTAFAWPRPSEATQTPPAKSEGSAGDAMLDTVYGFNLRSMAMMTGLRGIFSLASMMTASLEMIRVDIQGYTNAHLLSRSVDSPLSIGVMMECFERSVTACIELLEQPKKLSLRSKFCLAVVLRSLVQTAVGLLGYVVARPIQSRQAEGIASNYRAFFQFLVSRLARICREDEEETVTVARSIRFILYSCISSVAALGGYLTEERDGGILASVYVSEVENIDGLLKKVLFDLVGPETLEERFSSSLVHNPLERMHRSAKEKQVFSCQDVFALASIFSPKAPPLAGVILLKQIVDTSVDIHRAAVSRLVQDGLMSKWDTSGGASNLEWSSSRPLQRSSRWFGLGIIEAVGRWVADVCGHLSDTTDAPAATQNQRLPSSDHLERTSGKVASTQSTHDGSGGRLPVKATWKTLPAQDSQDLLSLMYSIIGQLAQHPALAEAILCPTVPISLEAPQTSEAPCRTALFDPPFLPKKNIELSSRDFGFVDISNALRPPSSGRRSSRSVIFPHEHFHSHRLRPLPYFLGALSNFLKHLETVNIRLVLESAGQTGGSPMPAGLVFIKWWLGRDRQWGSVYSFYDALLHQFESGSSVQAEWGEDGVENSESFVRIDALTKQISNWSLAGDKDDLQAMGRQDEFSDEDNTSTRGTRDESDVKAESKKIGGCLERGAMNRGQLFQGVVEQLMLMFVSVTRVWSQLLTGYLLHSEKTHSIRDGVSELTVDENLLVFGFQDRVAGLGMKLAQLGAFRATHGYGVKSLLPPQSIDKNELEMLVPPVGVLRQLLSRVMICIEIELRLFERYGSKRQGQQIEEQMKRYLSSRNRTLVVIINALFVGFLQEVPLVDAVRPLSKEIEALTGVARHGVPDLIDVDVCRNGEETRRALECYSSATVLRIRLLTAAIPAFLKGFQLFLRYEGIPVEIDALINSEEMNDEIGRHYSVATFGTRKENAFVHDAFTALHPSLDDGTCANAAKLCGKICGCLTEVASAPPALAKAAGFEGGYIASPVVVAMGLKMVCVESLKLCSLIRFLLRLSH